MSLLPLLTHANPKQVLYLPYFSTASLNTSTISTGSITANTMNVSSLIADHISCISLDSEYINTSTVNAIAIDIDGQILTAAPNELLLNGIPVATISSLSSIADWSLEPAISTVQMAGNDLNAAGTISSANVRAGNGFFTNLIAFNAMFVSTQTSTISSVVTIGDEGNYSTLNVGNLSSPQIINLSSINGLPISFYQPGAVSTVSTFVDLTTSSLTVSSINGAPIISGSNWSQYAATSAVDIANYQLNNVAVIGTPSNLDVNAFDGVINMNAESMNVTCDNGFGLTNATINVTAKNGVRGEINVIADTGKADIGGVLNLTANGGVTPLGVAYGGEVNITATTGTFTSLALTSAVNLNAAGINSYAGATAPIGSLAGGNFVHGDSIVNITAGIPPIFSDPLCVYLRGTNGILMDSAVYVNGPIRPYSDLVKNPIDLYIESYSNGITKGYIQLRGISTATFEGGDTAILGLNKVAFSSIGGEVTGLSSINGFPIGDYANISSISSLNEWALYPALSSINANGGDVLNIKALEFSTIGGALTGVSSINGQSIGVYENSQYIFCSSLTVPGAYSTSVGLIKLGFTDGLDGGQLQFDTLENSSTFQLLRERAPPAGGSSLILTLEDQSNNYSDMSLRGIYFGNGTVASGANGRIVAGPGGLQLALVSSINGAPYPPLNPASLSTSAITTSSISTAVILGANSNLFGLGLPGLEINSANLFLSTPSVVHPGNFNGSTCSFRAASISSLTAGSILTSSIALNSGVYSTILVPQAGPNPGIGTSSCLFVNADLNLGNNDLYAQQIRLGKGQLDNFAEILMYGNDGSTKNLLTGSADRTFRVASSVAPTGPGYVLDTTMNPPFFSTINQSTACMAYFPSSIANTIGVSTIGYIPPKIVAGAFTSLSTQTVIAANTPLTLNLGSADFTVGGISVSTTAIVIPAPGIYEIGTSIQLDKVGGGVSECDFWFRKNGTDIPNSASEVTVQGTNGECLATVSLILPLTTNDKIELVIASADNTMAATFFQSTVTTPYTRPAIPSIITNVKCLNY